MLALEAKLMVGAMARPRRPLGQLQLEKGREGEAAEVWLSVAVGLLPHMPPR